MLVATLAFDHLLCPTLSSKIPTKFFQTGFCQNVPKNIRFTISDEKQLT